MAMRTIKVVKSHKYGTRQLIAGEEYELPPRHAVALVAAKKARFADRPAARTAAPPEPPAAESPPDEPELPVAPAMTLDALRLEANALGIPVDGRWGTTRLQQEINQAKGR